MLITIFSRISTVEGEYEMPHFTSQNVKVEQLDGSNAKVLKMFFFVGVLALYFLCIKM